MSRNLKARRHSSPAVRAALVRRSRSASPPMGQRGHHLRQGRGCRGLRRESNRKRRRQGDRDPGRCDRCRAVGAAVQKTVASLGNLDVLVNNAGTAIPKKFEETTLEELDRMIDLNFRGVFMTTQAALKHMNDGGRIVMIGSCVGERMMTPGLVPYSATKSAMRMFAQGLSRRSRRPRHHREQHPAGPDRHRPQSRSRRLGHATEGRHRAQPLRQRRRCRCAGRLRRGARSLLHHRRQSDGRWRHECVSV